MKEETTKKLVKYIKEGGRLYYFERSFPDSMIVKEGFSLNDFEFIPQIIYFTILRKTLLGIMNVEKTCKRKSCVFYKNKKCTFIGTYYVNKFTDCTIYKQKQILKNKAL